MLPAPVVTRFARLARAGVLGVVAVSLASAAHLLAGGAVLSAPSLVVTAGVIAAASAALLGVEASRRRIVGLVLGQQVILHLLLAYTGLVSGGMDMGAGAVAVPGMTMPGMAGPPTLSHGPSVSWSMLGEHLVGDVGTAHGVAMACAHLVAAAGVGWWLALGERLLWSLLVMMAAGGAAALLRDAVALLEVARARTDVDALWVSALLRQRDGRWSVRTWEPISRLELRGPPTMAGPDFA